MAICPGTLALPVGSGKRCQLSPSAGLDSAPGPALRSLCWYADGAAGGSWVRFPMRYLWPPNWGVLGKGPALAPPLRGPCGQAPWVSLEPCGEVGEGTGSPSQGVIICTGHVSHFTCLICVISLLLGRTEVSGFFWYQFLLVLTLRSCTSLTVGIKSTGGEAGGTWFISDVGDKAKQQVRTPPEPQGCSPERGLLLRGSAAAGCSQRRLGTETLHRAWRLLSAFINK